ncbi:MAG: phosphate transport system regulatory protein PhoU, partial [Alphaproteobacteria bacterium]
NDLERIGDYAVSIAKRSQRLAEQAELRSIQQVMRIGQSCLGMVKDVLDAYVARDAEKAIRVRDRDRAVDDLYNSLFRELLTYMMENPRNISTSTHLLFIAKNIERIGDHATNIAEIVYFSATGEPIDSARPKQDETPYTIVAPPADIADDNNDQDD